MKDKLDATILFLPMQQRVVVAQEDSLLELALKNDIGIAHSCGGMGTCGTCRVKIQSPLADIAERNAIEQEMATDRAFRPEERLACQLTPQPNMIASVCYVLDDLDKKSD